MATLACLGLGYCARHYVAEFGARFDRIVGTTRTAEKAVALGAQRFGGRAVEMHVFDGTVASPGLRAAVEEADSILLSAAPAEGGDPVLAAFGKSISAEQPLRSVVYLSTIGVYADSGGAWIDETADVVAGRRSARADVERAWQDLCARYGVAFATLRLGGIYGPGQNMLSRLRRGPVPRIAKPGHVLNRIHVDDIAQAIDATIDACAEGAFNLVDDEPAPASEVTAFAAGLLGIAPEPETPYADAGKVLSPAALGFYERCIRVRNDKLKHELGVTLRYPTYREGLRALYATEPASPR